MTTVGKLIVLLIATITTVSSADALAGGRFSGLAKIGDVLAPPIQQIRRAGRRDSLTDEFKSWIGLDDETGTVSSGTVIGGCDCWGNPIPKQSPPSDKICESGYAYPIICAVDRVCKPLNPAMGREHYPYVWVCK